MVSASVAEFDLGSHGGQQFARGFDVAHLRNVFEDHRLVGEQSGGHAGQGGVFRSTDADGAEQRRAAADYEFIHCVSYSLVFIRFVSRLDEFVVKDYFSGE